jgi:hypothetical protein
MKPVNFDSASCSPISSNCVIWQGPDITCINLCNGDTISDVTYKLATELCTIMDTLNVSNYDLSCFNITSCGPNDFNALIQFLIEKICELENLPTGTAKSGGGCPTDCIVTVAECFQSSLGLTANLVDYVNAIGTKLCTLAADLTTLNAKVDIISNKVDVIWDTYCKDCEQPAIFTTLTCPSMTEVFGTAEISVDTFLNDFFSDGGVWCNFFSVLTGSDSGSNLIALSNSLNPAAPCDISDFNQLYPNGLELNLEGADNLPQALANIWQILCALKVPVTITPQDTTTIITTVTGGPTYNISSQIADTGWHCLKGFDFYTDLGTNGMIIAKPKVRRIGNVLHFKGTLTIPLDNYNDPGTVVTYLYKAGTNTYEGTSSGSAHGNAPYQGTGGVTVNSSGNLNFFKGANMIPEEVLPAGYAIDGGYSFGWRLGWRSMATSSCSTILTTWANVAVGTNGNLIWGCIADLEESFATGCNPGAFSTSHLNYTISNVIQGQYVPKFDTALNVHSSALTGNQPDISFTDPNTVIAGVGVPFSYSKQSGPDFKAGDTYPITINANDPGQLGGFQLVIDGLTAFIGPCVDPIPAPTLDVNACAGTCPTT